MEFEYSFEQKEKLAKQIQRLKKKQHFIDIQNIITKYNPDINITTNQSGHFMYFQNLKTDTYIAIDKYIKKITIKRFLSENSDNTETQNMNSNNEKNLDDIKKYSSEIEPFTDNHRLKYSNREKNLIKRKNYDDQICGENTENSNKIENSNKLYSIRISKNIQHPIQHPTQSDDVKKIFVKRKTAIDKKKINNIDPDTTITLS